MGRQGDIRVKEARVSYEDYSYRTPIKFGGRVLDKVTILNVALEVESRDGRRATGFGSMTLGNVWAWPSAKLSYDQTLSAMKGLARELGQGLPADVCAEFAHPIEHGIRLEEAAVLGARSAVAKLGLGEEMPKLAALVAASAFDAALHDAFGKAQGAHSYARLGREHMERDLSGFLDGSFAGKYLDQYALPHPKESLSLYHLVGALDPLTSGDVKLPVGDGLPETLYEWIGRDGLTHLKIKLNGEDLDWDVERVLAVSHVADMAEKDFCRRQWSYSLDFNEKCPNVEYLLEFLAALRECRPDVLEGVQYIEQPTARDLKANPGNKMHRAARIKPVVIDESLVDYESLLLAQEMGYSGVALKACKGITQSLLLGAAAQEKGMFVCVQDLTCVGVSFLQSAGLAAHLGTVTAVEGNGRQYCPEANEAWEDMFPRTFRPNAGLIDTQALSGIGLGCVPEGHET